MENMTPLHFGARKNSKEIGELLILKGANINAIDIISRISDYSQSKKVKFE